MPVFLAAPRIRPGGPDGQGWNRLRAEAGFMCGDECALKPLTGSKLFESWNTRRAHYGSFGPCGGRGKCETCPVFARLSKPRPRLTAFTDRILFRAHPSRPGEMWAMNHPERGWESSGRIWSLDELALVTGWEFDGYHHDEDGEGFWLRRSDPNSQES